MATDLKSVTSSDGTYGAVPLNTSTPVLIVARNARRKQVLIGNPTTNTATIWVGPDDSITINSAPVEIPPGKAMIDSGEGLYEGPWYGILTTGTDSARQMELT